MQCICHQNICNHSRVNFIEWSRDCSKHAKLSTNLHLVAIFMPPLQQGLRRGPEMMTYLRPVQSKLAKLINFASCCLEWGAASVHENFPKIQRPLWSHREKGLWNSWCNWCSKSGAKLPDEPQWSSYLTVKYPCKGTLSQYCNVLLYCCEMRDVNGHLSLDDVRHFSFQQNNPACKNYCWRKNIVGKNSGVQFSISQKI